MTNFFCIRYRPHLPEVRVGREVILSPHGALTCLYGVTYSRASPRLFLGVIFVSIRHRPHAPRGASGEGGYPVTAWRTNVLIRCFLQPSLFEAPRWCNFFSIRTERIRSTCFDVQKNCGVPTEEYAARFQTVLFMKLNIISNYFRGSF